MFLGVWIGVIPGKGWVAESGAICHPGIRAVWGDRVLGILVESRYK